ncbi:MAG: hypothetical protein R2881_07550 [Eubacteriales bacterium]
MIFTWVKNGKPDVSMSLNGALAGLVANPQLPVRTLTRSARASSAQSPVFSLSSALSSSI